MKLYILLPCTRAEFESPFLFCFDRNGNLCPCFLGSIISPVCIKHLSGTITWYRPLSKKMQSLTKFYHNIYIYIYISIFLYHILYIHNIPTTYSYIYIYMYEVYLPYNPYESFTFPACTMEDPGPLFGHRLHGAL